ncbi:hypothetical protein BU24DRAFT_452870 [Aaosphaeria arxii CBS 175.79]|uniref:CCHC-type domain-containing protein n=1 Tax=Aaosphaeria arxii CBS 175.79 TaxID=1450172 RepID=A0A6A5XHT9_9PLEO|nr:uncharacterized protein BU24DRAFT_452870 [Aaosphaeria arxii CBS 175.79]KAF2012439.1 hypothetical protein BU24DRAFT_452870 [Aaosphaeria arxii CBS 175.79]
MERVPNTLDPGLCIEYPGVGARHQDTFCIRCGFKTPLDHRLDPFKCTLACFCCGQNAHSGKACPRMVQEVSRWWWRARGLLGPLPGVPQEPRANYKKCSLDEIMSAPPPILLEVIRQRKAVPEDEWAMLEQSLRGVQQMAEGASKVFNTANRLQHILNPLSGGIDKLAIAAFRSADLMSHLLSQHFKSILERRLWSGSLGSRVEPFLQDDLETLSESSSISSRGLPSVFFSDKRLMMQYPGYVPVSAEPPQATRAPRDHQLDYPTLHLIHRRPEQPQAATAPRDRRMDYPNLDPLHSRPSVAISTEQPQALVPRNYQPGYQDLPLDHRRPSIAANYRAFATEHDRIYQLINEQRDNVQESVQKARAQKRPFDMHESDRNTLSFPWEMRKRLRTTNATAFNHGRLTPPFYLPVGEGSEEGEIVDERTQKWN